MPIRPTTPMVREEAIAAVFLGSLPEVRYLKPEETKTKRKTRPATKVMT